jgi:hypothetical protein
MRPDGDPKQSPRQKRLGAPQPRFQIGSLLIALFGVILLRDLWIGSHGVERIPYSAARICRMPTGARSCRRDGAASRRTRVA